MKSTSAPIGIFYDNQAKNFKQREDCPCIFPIKVSESEAPSGADETMERKSTYLTILDRKGKRFAQRLWAMQQPKEEGTVDMQSGLSKEQMKQLLGWVTAPGSNVKLVVFDWDRTLTKIEGVPALSALQSIVEGITPGSDARYYLGGKKRLRRLQYLWKRLTDFGVQIEVLTNNVHVPTIEAIMRSGRLVQEGNENIKPLLVRNTVQEDGSSRLLKYQVLRREWPLCRTPADRCIEPKGYEYPVSFTGFPVPTRKA